MATRLTGSDVTAVFITADAQALDADGISAAAAVGNNAALTIGGALADGGSVTNVGGRIVTILSAGDDSAKSFTVVGTAVGNPAGNVSAGINTAVADVIFGGRSRLQGVNVVCSATAGNIDFLNTSTSGSSLFKLGCVASATSTRDITVPDNGLVFSDGVYINYTTATFTSMTAFHA